LGLLFLSLCILLSLNVFLISYTSHIIYRHVIGYLIPCFVVLGFWCFVCFWGLRQEMEASENIECGSFKHNLVIMCQDISLSKSTNNLTFWKQLVCTFHYFIYFLLSFAYTSLSFGFVVFKKNISFVFWFCCFFFLIPFFVGLFVFLYTPWNIHVTV
jgi:hypothetical protein